MRSELYKLFPEGMTNTSPDIEARKLFGFLLILGQVFVVVFFLIPNLTPVLSIPGQLDGAGRAADAGPVQRVGGKQEGPSSRIKT
jgi:hypothetical protein